MQLVLQPETPEALITNLREIGRRGVVFDPLRDNPDAWEKTPELFAAAGIEIVSGMFGTIGEDYTTPETTTNGGVLPDQHWDANWSASKIADIAEDSASISSLSTPASLPTRSRTRLRQTDGPHRANRRTFSAKASILFETAKPPPH